MSKKLSIKVEKTANFYVLGNLEQATTIWFVLHGYGYLAQYFIKKFNPILNPNTCVVAPEGLSKFYLNGDGVDGRVGASWMTKESREEEIEDYVNYLNKLYHNLVNTDNIKINIVGFSQGGATASRWISDGKIRVDNFILWSTVFPEDMQFKAIEHTPTFFVCGDNDEYVTKERIEAQKALITKANAKITTIYFNGKHDIPKDVLLAESLKNNW